MSTTEYTTYTVTAVLPGEFDQPGQIEVIEGASYEAAHEQYVRLIAEQTRIIGTHTDEAAVALDEAENVVEAVELSTHFTGSWQIELRADKAPVIA